MSSENTGRPRGRMGRGMTGEKAKDFKGTIKKLLVYRKLQGRNRCSADLCNRQYSI